jgi:hypothetical protein
VLKTRRPGVEPGRCRIGDFVTDSQTEAQSESQGQAEQDDQRQDPSSPAPLAPEAFHGLAGDFVRVVSPHTESDEAGLLIQFLVCFGNAAGRSFYFQVESDKHSANENIVLVGRTSSGRKGTSLSRVRAPFRLADPHWERNCTSSGLSSGEGLIHFVRDPSEHKEGRTVVVDQGQVDKRLLVVETEFSSTLKVARREGNILSGVLRQAWDSGDLRLMTKNSPTKATNAHVSVIAHIPEDELLRCC